MKRRDLRYELLIKISPLIDISHRKIRHRTEEEEKRYIERRKKALQYLGEIVSAKRFLDEVGDRGEVVSDYFIEECRKPKPDKMEVLLKGDFVKLYRFEERVYMVVASVKDIKSFK